MIAEIEFDTDEDLEAALAEYGFPPESIELSFQPNLRPVARLREIFRVTASRPACAEMAAIEQARGKHAFKLDQIVLVAAKPIKRR